MTKSKGTVIIDPPWPYQKASEGGHRTGYSNFKYAPLSIRDLEKLPIEDLGDYVFLWTTGPFIQDAYDLIDKWGFKPITFLVWVKTNRLKQTDTLPFKPSYGVGFWFRGCVELILVAKASHVKSIRTPWVGLICDNAEHSRKPNSLHELIEQSFPQPWTELFGRSRRKGWVVLGDEINGVDIRTSTIRLANKKKKGRKIRG